MKFVEMNSFNNVNLLVALSQKRLVLSCIIYTSLICFSLCFPPFTKQYKKRLNYLSLFLSYSYQLRLVSVISNLA